MVNESQISYIKLLAANQNTRLSFRPAFITQGMEQVAPNAFREVHNGIQFCGSFFIWDILANSNIQNPYEDIKDPNFGLHVLSLQT